MYKKHKNMISVTFLLVFGLTFYLGVDFENIVSECISIVSFALSAYAICFSSLIGSLLLGKLHERQDDKIPEKTQLGVLKTYIKTAIYISVITLIVACVNKIQITNLTILKILDYLKHFKIQQIFSSFCFAIFSLNFLMIIFIFIFIINRQME